VSNFYYRQKKKKIECLISVMIVARYAIVSRQSGGLKERLEALAVAE
jgi:hypothetical protein